MIKLDEFDSEELARGVFNLTDDDDVEQKLYEEFEINFDQWHKIVDTLIRLTNPMQSSLTGTYYHAFIKEGLALAKLKVE